MHCITNSLASDPATADKSADSLQKCITWLDQMSAAYRFSPKYRLVLSSLALLAKRNTLDVDKERDKATYEVSGTLSSFAGA